MKVVFLTPTYNNQCEIGQRWPFAASILHLERSGHIASGSGTTRGLLDHARNKLMEPVLASDADVAIWIDDDMVWKDMSIFTSLCKRLEENPEVILVAINFADQKGQPISRGLDNSRLPPDYNGEAAFVSLGVSAMRLDWYREKWPKPQPPWFQIVPQITTSGQIADPMTEGFYHCMQLRKRGGKVWSVSFECRNGDADFGRPAPWALRGNA